MLQKPIDWWPVDPLPLGAYAYRHGSINFWREVTKAVLASRK